MTPMLFVPCTARTTSEPSERSLTTAARRPTRARVPTGGAAAAWWPAQGHDLPPGTAGAGPRSIDSRADRTPGTACTASVTRRSDPPLSTLRPAWSWSRRMECSAPGPVFSDNVHAVHGMMRLLSSLCTTTFGVQESPGAVRSIQWLE